MTDLHDVIVSVTENGHKVRVRNDIGKGEYKRITGTNIVIHNIDSDRSVVYNIVYTGPKSSAKAFATVLTAGYKSVNNKHLQDHELRSESKFVDAILNEYRQSTV